MKRSISTLLCLVFVLFVGGGLFAQQNVAKETVQNAQKGPKDANSKVFKHVSQYKNLPLIESMPVTENAALQKRPDPVVSNPDQGGLKSTESRTYYSSYMPDGYSYTSLNGYDFHYLEIGLYPPLYNYTYNGYATQWQPVTFTLPRPAQSVTINVWDDWYYYWYYGARLTVYDVNGSYLGQVYSWHNGWGEITFNAPAGTQIGSYVVQSKYYSNYSFYIWYSRIVYANQAPVVKAQNVTVNADANCQAEVNADAVNNRSYDPDGDRLSFSLSPAGPYPVGTTNVTLTASDNESSSSASATITVVDAAPPTLSQPSAVSQDNDLGVCGAAVVLTAPDASDNCGVASVTSDAPAVFPTGTTTVTWTATDIHGNLSQVTQEVTVVDAEAPVLSVTTEVINLWPANHKYQTISLGQLLVSVSDNCGLNSNGVFIKSVSSDEPEDTKGGGDGTTKDDMVIGNDCSSVFLRAEREGNGNGRVYTITLSVSDEAGNETTATCFVQVPHDKKDTAVDDGAAAGYTVFSNCGGKSGIQINPESGTVAQGLTLKTYPNPFLYSTQIVFDLPEETHVNLSVYDMMGHLVNTMIDKNMSSGQSQVNWDGTSSNGQSLSRGMYFIILRTDTEVTRSTVIMEK